MDMRKLLTSLAVISAAVLSFALPAWATGPQVKAVCASPTALKLTVTNVGPEGTVNGVWGLATLEPRLANGVKVPSGAVITWTATGLTPHQEYGAGVQIVYSTGTHATDPFKVTVNCDGTTTTTASAPTTEASTAPTTPTTPETTVSVPTTAVPYVPPTISIPETVQPSVPVTDTAEGITGTEATSGATPTEDGRLPSTGAGGTVTIILFAGGFLVIGGLLLAARRRVSVVD